MKPISLTKAQFSTKIINLDNPSSSQWNYLGDRPALVDFYADWCGPCKALSPVLEELAATYAGKIYIYKVNTEQEEELAALFAVRSIPSLLFIPMVGKPQMSQGALPKSELSKAIDQLLLGAPTTG